MGFFDKMKQRRMDDISKKMSTHTHISKKISTHSHISKKMSTHTEDMAQSRYTYPDIYVDNQKLVNAKKLLIASAIFGTSFKADVQRKLTFKISVDDIKILTNQGIWD